MCRCGSQRGGRGNRGIQLTEHEITKPRVMAMRTKTAAIPEKAPTIIIRVVLSSAVLSSYLPYAWRGRMSRDVTY